MDIDAINWANWQDSIIDPRTPDRAPGEQELDREAFLRLLTTQLQFQDPLNPMEDHAFVAQLAQFSALEQQQQTNLNMQRTQALSLVGRDVVAHVRNEATGHVEEVLGRVNVARMVNGEPQVAIQTSRGVRQVPLSEVMYIGDDLSVDMLARISETLLASQNLSLVGQYAQFVEHNSDGAIIAFTEGRITSLRFDRDYGIMLTVEGREVTASQVQEISDQPLVVGRPLISGMTLPTEDNIIGDPFTNATIQSVTVNGSDGFILETDRGRVLLGDIDNLTAAFRTVGTLFSQGDYHGMVTGIVMSAGRPMLRLDNGDTVLFERGTNASVLVGREISWQRSAADELRTDTVLRVEREGDYHNLVVNTGTEQNAQEETIFVRNLDMLTQASNQVGRSINGQNIEGVRIRNGNAYLVLADETTLLFTGQTTQDPI